MEAAPLAMQEAPLDMPEAQSPTLIIQGILGELDPTREIANVPGVVEGEEEEEGLSSTLKKEDAEDRRAVSIVQVMDSSVKQPEVPTALDVPLELVETLPRDENLL